jgi:hypothetical protein
MSQHNERYGDWLSAKGEYRHLIHGLCNSDPRLRRRDRRAVKHEYLSSTSATRVMLLEAQREAAGSACFAQPFPLTTAQALNEHLETRPTNDIGRVYILEGLHPAFHAVLGDHFGMHPSFFAEHERINVISSQFTQSDSMVLPSIAASREHVILKYFELFNLPEECQDTFLLDCAITGRHIGVTRYLGFFSKIGILRRKCSIWRRQAKSGKGWDCMSTGYCILKKTAVSYQSRHYHHRSSTDPCQAREEDRSESSGNPLSWRIYRFCTSRFADAILRGPTASLAAR